jgi:serine/threonine protein kinase
MAMPPPPPRQRRITFEVPPSHIRRAFDSYVHDQGSQGTCYAQVAATLQRDAEQRAGLAVRSTHEEARRSLIQSYGIYGAILERVLEKVVSNINAKIGTRGPATLRNCTADEARDVLRNRLGKLGVSFCLDEAQWKRFKTFFTEHPCGTLSRRDIGPRVDGHITGHAVVIEAEATAASSSNILRGMGPVDSSKVFVFKNSWGASHAARGSCLVESNALDHLKFYHIDLPESATDLHALFEGAGSVPPDLTERVFLDKKSGHHLGKGSFGEVWRATLDGTMGVAVKIFLNGKQQVLLDETRHLISLAGEPNVVSVLGMMHHDGGWALVMPLMKRDLSGRGSLNTARVALDLAKGLRAVHARDLIHCDVKDANVFLSDGGEAVLGDFGSCISASQHPKPGRIGTSAYRDPSVRSGSYGSEVDIYSFGKVLEALLQREQHQYAEQDMLRRLARHCHVHKDRRPTARLLVTVLERIVRSTGSSSDGDVRELVPQDLDGSTHVVSDSETRALGATSTGTRMLTGTTLDTECRSIDREFIFYVSSQGRFHHPLCGMVQKWHKQSSSTKFTKQPFAKICKNRRSKGCKFCEKFFNFRALTASGRSLPCPVPLDEAQIAVDMATRNSRVPFSSEEDEYLREGMQRFGWAHDKWIQILKNYPFLARRSNMDLKDRWRNLLMKEARRTESKGSTHGLDAYEPYHA